MERQNFIREEVCKMLHAGFIEEVHHPEWLAKPAWLRVDPQMVIDHFPGDPEHL